MSRLLRSVLALAFVGAVASVSGCATAAPPETAPEPDTVLVVDTVRVEAGASAELEARVAKLQMDLLEKEGQLAEVTAQLDAARQEVVRTMAKLQSQASRAEAASGIAEAEIAVRDLRAAAGRQPVPEIAQAQQLLEMSGSEFNQDNYAGSLYLATQARAVAETGENRVRGGGGNSVRPGEVLFAVPVRLETLRRSNVREGPGLNFAILFTLDAGTSLIGRSHTDEWVRVSDERGRAGWIFHDLVGTRQ
jgi:hypothetical protein